MKAVRACLVGASGRMGQQIVALSREARPDYKVEIACGVVSPGSPHRGRSFTGVEEPLYSFDDKIVARCDVIIDFSSPNAVNQLIAFTETLNLPLVVGTTGLCEESIALLRRLSKRCPVLCSSNMSVGMNTMFWLAGVLGKKLGGDYDVEIVELHHSAKKDAPSGSALTLAGEVATARGEVLDKVLRSGRHGSSERRVKGEVGVQAVRGGDVPGEHTLYFLGKGERIEITHRVSNRVIFAQGALQAASWLVNQPPGFYSMRDVLELVR